MRKYLDIAARAGRLPGHLPIYNTEFGLPVEPAGPVRQHAPSRQAQLINEKEEYNYRYARLKSYSQYLLYDDPARPGRAQALRGFQTGLRFRNGKPKPALGAYKLPIVVHKRGAAVCCVWGRVRPGTGSRYVQLQRNGKQDGNADQDQLAGLLQRQAHRKGELSLPCVRRLWLQREAARHEPHGEPYFSALALSLGLPLAGCGGGGGSGNAERSPEPGQWSMFEDHSALVRTTPVRRERTLRELQALGADTLRIEAKWNEIAPAPLARRRPSFDAADPAAYPGFGPYDDLFRRADSKGFRVLLTLAPEAPRWATAGGQGNSPERANLRPARGRVREVRRGRRKTLFGQLPGPAESRVVLDLERAESPVVPEAARRGARDLPPTRRRRRACDPPGRRG